MFVESSSLQKATVFLGSNGGRPRGERMKPRHEHISTKKRAPTKPLTNSQSQAQRTCGFCKTSGHYYSGCSFISNHKASGYKKQDKAVKKMIDYLGNDGKYQVQVLPHDVSRQFREDQTQWNCRLWPQGARHIMLCDLYRDFRQANSSEGDNIVAVQFFKECGVPVEGPEVYYSEVKKVKEWLGGNSGGLKTGGLVLTKLIEVPL
jgi:hypothetical protein